MPPMGPNPNQYEKQINPCPDQSLLGRSNNQDPPPAWTATCNQTTKIMLVIMEQPIG